MAIRLIINRRGAPAGERTFDGEIITIGSDPSSALHLDDSSVAPEQAIIISEDGRLLLINRADGTRLGEESLPREARRPLTPGDSLSFGPYTIRLAPDGEPARAQQNADRQATLSTPAPPATAADAQASPHASNDSREERREPGRQQEPATPARAEPSARSFATILDSLRTEEDSFYFQIESGGARRRVPVEGAEIVVGWDETGRGISCEASGVVAPRAVVRKDWSGVVVLPFSAGMVSVNGEAVEGPRRLRNGDRLTLLPTAVAADPGQNYLVFHEPASLVVLDTLLPQQLPPPVAPAPSTAATARAETATAAALAPVAATAVARRRASLLSPDRRYFGYFTFAEVVVMACGTLVAAVIIFLVLEYS